MSEPWDAVEMDARVRQATAAPAWQPADPAPIETLAQRAAVPLAGITADSREAAPGQAFAAMPGLAGDGRDYIPQAILRGASAVLWERQDFFWRDEWRVPNLPVVDLRGQLGPIAAVIYGRPSRDQWVAGVTGTNGKTSCSTWIAQAESQLGRHCALIGTLGTGFPGELAAPTHTTPDAARVQALIADFAARGAQGMAMEASSHGLDQGRVNGVEFDVAVFTNLSRDHLDYHGDMAHYGAAKARLFAMPGLTAAVINVDDPFGQVLARVAGERTTRVIGYGLEQGDLRGEALELSGRGITMTIAWEGRRERLQSPLLGRFNAHNLLAVIGALLAGGHSLADAVAAAARLRPVAGRLQQLGGHGQPIVAIDYAHTPDALEKVLAALRPVVPAGGRLICVFGCGGNRDRGKRPLMGAIAARLADLAIVTSDNPRWEEPAAILEQIVAGMRDADFQVIEDREVAIFRAVEVAGPEDIVLLAGKGHEAYQQVGDEKRPFSDAEVAGRALAART